MPADIVIIGRPLDTVFLFVPKNTVAQTWLDENIEGEVTVFGRGIAVEHRYVNALAAAIKADGLTVAWRHA